MSIIIEIEGNIFESKCQTIVNTVNCEGVMGKGIALEFKNRYPDMFKSYHKLCIQNLIKPGILQLYSKSSPWILNFPTKLHWRLPSKLEYIELGLKKFASEYNLKNINSIAFPKLGTMNGGLDWVEVKSLMYRYLQPLDNLKVEIYHHKVDSHDILYNQFVNLVLNYDVADIKKYIGLTQKQSGIVYEIIHNGVKNFNQLEKANGLGKKSIEKIKIFTASHQNNQSFTNNKQLKIPF